MKSKLLILTLLICIGITNGAHAQNHKNNIIGSKVIETEERTIKDFKKIKVSMGVNVYLKQGGQEKIKVEGDDNIISHIITNVEGNTLEITFDPANSYSDIKSANVYLSVGNLDGLEAKTGGNFIIDGILKADNLSFTLSSGGSLKGELSVKDLFVKVNSGSQANIKGKSESANINVDGGSKLEGKEFEVEKAILNVSNASLVSISSLKEISIVARGEDASTVKYYGNPTVLKKEVSGGSKVQNLKIK